MKIIALLLLLLVALVSSMDYEEADRCKKPCFKKPYEPVCATMGHQADTFYNECEMNCDRAVKKHDGDCTFEDMLYNRVIYK